jgi:hypothetical protein
MREHQNLSYAELVEELQALAAKGSTGVMFIRTESGHSVRIGLQNGRVVSCNYRMYQQQKAISLIRQIRSGEYAFKQGVPGLVFGEELPANFDFFRELTGESSRSSLIARQDSSPGATDLRISGGELFEAVVQELTTYMGPIARMVAMGYEKELRSVTSGEQVRAVVFRLAQEIDEPSSISAFEARILGLVSSWQCPVDS